MRKNTQTLSFFIYSKPLYFRYCIQIKIPCGDIPEFSEIKSVIREFAGYHHGQLEYILASVIDRNEQGGIKRADRVPRTDKGFFLRAFYVIFYIIKSSDARFGNNIVQGIGVYLGDLRRFCVDGRASDSRVSVSFVSKDEDFFS